MCVCLYGAEEIDMKEELCKVAAQAAIRGEIGISNMKSRIARSRLLYLRRIETGNNEVLKRILEDNKKST